MSTDWNWGIFLQPAPFGNTTYLADLEWFPGHCRPLDFCMDYRIPCRIAIWHSAYGSKPVSFKSWHRLCRVIP